MLIQRRSKALFLVFTLRSQPAATFHPGAVQSNHWRLGSSSNTGSAATFPDDFTSLRVSEIKNELRQRSIDYSDCFDKESLLDKLRQNASAEPKEATTTKTSTTRTNKPVDTSPQKDPTETSANDCDVDTVRAMSVKALREELARRGMRWADYIDKEDLIQAVVRARKEAAAFSATGLLRPGQVADLTGAQVQSEVESDSVPAPLLLDVYATWCGPCQIMVKELKEAATEWGDAVRVVKMDSDKYPELSGKWGVQGLPTLLLFKNGTEIGRMEGALQKSQLLTWVKERTEQQP